MPNDLVMIDLDGTLVDRDAAFRSSVLRFAHEHRLGPDAARWIMTIDARGYTPRAEVAASMVERYPSLTSFVCDALLAEGGCEDVVLDDAVAQALRRVRAAGRQIVVVTNGATAQQERKISCTGLDALVDGWVVSEAVGVAKPDETIFRIAAASVNCELRDAWMIGDNPSSDIRGAHILGCRTVWIRRGQQWPYSDFRPTRTVFDVATAITQLL